MTSTGRDSGSLPERRLWLGATLLLTVVVVGSAGYVMLGFTVLDAVYQTVTTVTTVGFREVNALGPGGKLFTMAVIVFGVGSALFTFSAVVESFVEGQVRQLVGRRRNKRRTAAMKDHVIVCGWGRVGRSISDYVVGAGKEVVVVDIDTDRLATVPHPTVEGDATVEATLREAGIDRASTLVAALSNDAGNVYVTLTARGMRPDLFIVSRARVEEAASKLTQAGADRVVNPQAIGGARMAAFVLQPHVAEFVDVVMHDGSLEFRLEEIPISATSPIAGMTIRDAHLRDRTGAMVLAVRRPDGSFATNPDPSTLMGPGEVLIAIGTQRELESLVSLAKG